jgi:type I restriction enzyme M protein
MSIKKSELYSSLWESCDELRGGMDASQYKDYVLVLLFVKYVSDKYAGQKDALLDVPVGGRFADMVALKGEKEIGDKINKIIGKLAEVNGLKGVIDVADFNDDDKLGKARSWWTASQTSSPFLTIPRSTSDQIAPRAMTFWVTRTNI